MNNDLELAIDVLNGLLGDYLKRTGNGLATEMQVVRRGRAVPRAERRGVRRAPRADRRRLPVPVEELLLIGHSMGGLVLRSAAHAASGWTRRWMVSIRSATGRARQSDRSVPFPQEHVRIMPALDHLRLANHPDVYAQIRAWCEEEA